MLSHVAKTSAVVIPVTAELGMDPFRVIRFVWSRAEPEIIVQFRRNRFRLQVVQSAPVEFPVEAGDAAYGNLQRPSQNTAVDKFFKRFHRGVQSIKLILESEPGVKAKHSSRLINSLNNFYTFTDGSCHWLLTPYILSCFRCHLCHYTVPVRGCRNMYNIDVGPGK